MPNKIFEFYSLKKAVAVVAENEQEAIEAMQQAGYSLEVDKPDHFWLENVCCQHFSEVFIAKDANPKRRFFF